MRNCLLFFLIRQHIFIFFLRDKRRVLRQASHGGDEFGRPYSSSSLPELCVPFVSLERGSLGILHFVLPCSFSDAQDPIGFHFPKHVPGSAGPQDFEGFNNL